MENQEEEKEQDYVKTRGEKQTETLQRGSKIRRRSPRKHTTYRNGYRRRSRKRRRKTGGGKQRYRRRSTRRRE